jgi:RNA polymerase sigma-70 factor (sigma-E family)
MGDLDVSSLEAVFRQDYVALCRLASLLIGGDRARAEELVMDAFTRCLRDWPRLNKGSAPAAYLRQAVVHRCYDHLRRRRIEWRVNALHSTRAVTASSIAESDDEVLRAVRALPIRQRTVIVLTYFADLSEADVAQELGIAAGTVKSQLAKARGALAQSLKERA